MKYIKKNWPLVLVEQTKLFYLFIYLFIYLRLGISAEGRVGGRGDYHGISRDLTQRGEKGCPTANSASALTPVELPTQTLIYVPRSYRLKR